MSERTDGRRASSHQRVPARTIKSPLSPGTGLAIAARHAPACHPCAAPRRAPDATCSPCTFDCANASGRPLQRLVRGGWQALHTTLEGSDRRLPAYVTREVERALSCRD